MAAFFGCLGYELDPTTLKDDEREAVKKQIAFYKIHRTTFQYGTYYRLLSPTRPVPVGTGLTTAGTGRFSACMTVAPDGGEAIAGIFNILANPNQKPFRLPLCGLDAKAEYLVSVWEDGGAASFTLPFAPGINFEIGDKPFNCGPRNGAELMQSGLLLDCTPHYLFKQGDFFSELFLIKRV
jgi:alpha-galactosidase